MVRFPKLDGRVVGFSAPHTLLCPVPFMDDEADNRLWEEIWLEVTGEVPQGVEWTEADAPAAWNGQDLAVNQICAWIAHQKQARAGTSPPWTNVFKRYEKRYQDVPFGSGLVLTVFWGSESDARRPTIDLSLPTTDSGSRWLPPADMPRLDEEDVFGSIPELVELRDGEGRVLFNRVEFEVPGREGKLFGWWSEHLDRLKSEGRLHVWSWDEEGSVLLGILRRGVLHVARLSESRLLQRSSVVIPDCTPLEQDPVPGSRVTEGELRFPDLPIRSDYLDLVSVAGDEGLLEEMRGDQDLDFSAWRPTVRSDGQGRQVVSWSLAMRGRAAPLPVEFRLEGKKRTQAHWMVWPRFRDRKSELWKAYYVYERCSNLRFHVDVLWLDAAQRVQRRRSPVERGAFPVAYRTDGEHPAHRGGPPLALCLRDTRLDEEQGLYLVRLENLPEVNYEIDLGVDFGTSHSVAAIRLGGSKVAEQVALPPELDPAHADKALTVHLSEAAKLIDKDEAGIAWMPTYTARANWGFLPSELMMSHELRAAQADEIESWEPGKDFQIPSFGIARKALARHLLTDFKWDSGSSFFLGREPQLREHYLSSLLELVMADVVRTTRGFPSRAVNMTFTYPLRSKEGQVEQYAASLERVLKRAMESLGIPLVLHRGVGLYDESRAARLSTEKVGEVCLVGDLGGGTLDLFISGHDAGGQRLDEVADSVRLGGNLLLSLLASDPERYLPTDGNWNTGDRRDTETKLRAWMRAEGSARLFGIDAGGRPSILGLDVHGFSRPADADAARSLINRYFRLLAEYMARNLAAYLAKHWFPTVSAERHERLMLTVQLRGNGWRLRYQDEDHIGATAAIQKLVRQRLEALWPQISDNEYPLPASDEAWKPAGHYRIDDPKTEPVKRIAGDSMAYAEVKAGWFAHPLVNLEVWRKSGSRNTVRWYDRVPFDTGGSRQVEVGDLEPPLVLSGPLEEEAEVLTTLAAARLSEINGVLKKEGFSEENLGFIAPVAALVWEAVFRSREFLPGSGGD